MSRGKHMTKHRYNHIKALLKVIDPSVPQWRISKALGISEPTLRWVTNTDTFDEYCEKRDAAQLKSLRRRDE